MVTPQEIATIVVLAAIAVGIVFWILGRVRKKRRAALVNRAVRQNGFGFESGAHWFAERVDELVPDDPDFDLLYYKYGAAYRRFAGRLVGIRGLQENDEGTMFDAIEIRLESTWSQSLPRGSKDAGRIKLSRRTKAPGLSNMLKQVLLSQDPNLRPEMAELKPFDAADEAFNTLFPVRFGGYRVRRALQTTDQLAEVAARLLRWQHLLYDFKLDSTECIVQLDCRKVTSWPILAGELMDLLGNLVAFADRLEQVLSSFQFSADDFHGPQPWYVGVTALATCQHCGAGLPLNGPVAEPICVACNQQNSFDEDLWTRLLIRPYMSYESNEGELAWAHDSVKLQHGNWRAELPACPGCRAPLPEDLINGQTVEAPLTFPCPACQHANTAAPVPEWVTQFAPRAVRMYNAETVSTASGAVAVNDEAAKPVLFACAQCGANLKITAEAERTITCEFCQASIYLPDGLWRKLHPVKTTTRWYLRYDHVLPKW